MIKLSKQSGSAHVIIIIALIVGLLGVVGFVFWNNFINKPVVQQENTATQEPADVTKKSEIIVLASGDMDKYVNYEGGFEFLFPKKVYGAVGCETKNTVSNARGQQVPSETYYSTVQGSAPVGVVEAAERYVIALKDTYILANRVHVGDYHLAKSCTKQATTLSLVDFENDLDAEKHVENVETREFVVTPADNTDAIVQFARKALSDDKASVTFGDIENDRQEVSFKYGPDYRVGGFAYKAWYYPAKKKLVYIALGQGAVLVDPKDRNKFYDTQVADSFKFVAN